MSNSARRDSDVSLLHPAIRNRVIAIRKQLHREKIHFEVFEAFRTPERQAALFAKGRSAPGDKVTWVGPWGSVHQYGLAVDFVLKPESGWSWDDRGAEAAHWDRMHALAKEHGMTPLHDSKGRLIEKPHIQLDGISAAELKRGVYPDGGDAAWAERLSELIDNWDGPGAPPKPDETPERPPLDPAVLSDLETESGPAPLAGPAEAEAIFAQVHGFVARWEGGFVDHPRDDGGPTNMGITMATLETHRGKPCTVDDMKALTRTEADAIYRSDYFTRCRCGEMPERMAAVVYNGAVLHGPRRSVEFIQRAFNALGMTADGKPLEVDGILGRMTMTALRKTDPTALAEAYMDLQEAHFRAHDDFDVFGAGWLNRLAALREFVSTLPQGAGLRPKTVMKISNRAPDLDLENLLDAALSARDGGRRAILRAVLGAAARDRLGADREDDLREVVLRTALDKALEGNAAVVPAAPPVVGSPGKPALTPVNAALGETLGHVLNGKKSVTGIVGLFLSVLISENAPGLGGLGAFANDHAAELITLFATVTGWGFLGKIDKAIRAVRVTTNTDTQQP